MKLPLPKNILEKINPIIYNVKKYHIAIFFTVVSLLLVFLIFRVNQLARIEPTEDQIQERIELTARPKVEPALIEKIQQLRDQNVQVEALFQQARENPFSE